MPAQNTLFPLEFYVNGTPISLQGSAASKERWVEKIARAARQRAAETDELGLLDRRPLAVTIYYITSAPMVGDIDNIVKPILDAMILIAYMDDQDVERVLVQKFEPDDDWEFFDPSEQLLAAFGIEPPVVYVRVDNDLSWRRS